MNSLKDVLDKLRQDPGFMDCVRKWLTIPAREGQFAEMPEDLHPVLRSVLTKKGIDRLYTHQAESYDSARSGRNTVVVTPTASGKTLCYNLPVLQTLLEKDDARALFLFPTKALSQDQQSALNELITEGEIPVKVFTYDGDTPGSLRMAARKTGRIIISNPDMIHSGILPNHTKWIEFFKSLKYIVIDEIHTYTGVFGSHVTNLLRRIKRIARFYGSDPVFICSSATIGNPGQLAETLIEQEFQVIDRNGAPSGEKNLILYNPPLVDPVQGIRRGVVLESRRLAVKMLKQKVKTIVFARSRVNAELISSYIKKSLANVYTDNSRINVESYRGGYLPKERRAIEKGLRDGTVHGVVSTNALELGIDIGGLDAAILAGVPASVSSIWQQAGRAGRSGDVSVAIIVASASPANQYLVNHPDYFEGASPESAFVDPENLYILLDHLKCAAFEKPFQKGETFGEDVESLLAYLEENGILRHTGDSWYWAERGYPAENVSLRGGPEQNVAIIDSTKGRNTVIGEMDAYSAKELIFKEAVYLHRDQQYMVLELDVENHICRVEESDVNYYTDSLVKTDIKVLTDDQDVFAEGCRLRFCDILLRRQVAKFKKLKFGTHENLGYGDIFLPEDEMHTRSVFLSFEEDSKPMKAFEQVHPELQAPVLSRLAHLLRQTAPIFLLCRPSDIGVAGRVRDTHYTRPGLFVYDNFPGGIGLAETLPSLLPDLLRACLDLVEGCGCERGCPSCVGPVDERDLFTDNPKTATSGFLAGWLRE